MSKSNRTYYRSRCPRSIRNTYYTRPVRRVADRLIRQQLERPEDDVVVAGPERGVLWYYWY